MLDWRSRIAFVGACLLFSNALAAPAEAQMRPCAPLPAASGPTITVGPADSAALVAAIQRATSGTTVLLSSGTYRMTKPLIIRTPGLTIRSASGNAGDVVIDAEYKVNEPFVIEASDTTLANLTITRAIDHLVHLVPLAKRNIRNVMLSGLRLIDAGEQFVKANPDGARSAFVDDVTVECSEFRLTDTGRPRIETLGGTQCYTGGIDVHAGRGWKVRNNHFEGLFCRTGFMAEHAVHFWMESRDTLVENNLIVNCARGIGFGLGPTAPATRPWTDLVAAKGYVGHVGGIIRNNIIVADIPEYDTGIGLEQAWGARVLHNTVFAAPSATKAFSSIDARFENTTASIHNNLVNNITQRANPTVLATHNIEQVSSRDFVGAARMDFHLRPNSKAVDAGLELTDAGVDMDGEVRGPKPDVGADERLRESEDSRRIVRSLALGNREAGHDRFGVVSETQAVHAIR